MKLLFLFSQILVGSIFAGHPTDIVTRLVSQVYTKTSNGFDLNLAPYFSISTFNIGGYNNISGFYKANGIPVHYNTRYGDNGSTVLVEHVERSGGKDGVGVENVDISNVDISDGQVETVYKFSVTKEELRSPVSWDINVSKRVGDDYILSIHGTADHSLVQNGEWSQVNFEVGNAELINSMSLIAQMTFKRDCFGNDTWSLEDECRLYGKGTSTLASSEYTVNFVHSDADHEIKVFREHDLILQLEPLSSDWFKYSMRLFKLLPKVLSNLQNLTKHEIGKLVIHLDSTIRSVQARIGWIAPCEEDFGIVFEKSLSSLNTENSQAHVKAENTTVFAIHGTSETSSMKDSIKSFCEQNVELAHKISETGKTMAFLGRRFLADTLSHTGQNEFREWWAKELKDREK